MFQCPLNNIFRSPLGLDNNGPPRPYLFYTRIPNYNAEYNIYLDEDNTYLPDDWTTMRYRCPVGDAAVFAAAPDLYDGDADSPLFFTADELDTLIGETPTNVFFSASRGLGVYAADADESLLNKALRWWGYTVVEVLSGWVDNGAVWADENGDIWSDV